MPTRLRTRLLQFVRRVVGTAQVREQQALAELRDERRHQQQKHMLLALGNALTYASSGHDQRTTSPGYRRCAEIVGRLSPMDLDGAQFVRLGHRHDGGYVMVEGISRDTVDAAYSFGVGRDASWECAIADRGVPVLMFDHMIAASPSAHSGCRHIRTGVTGHRVAPNRQPLAAIMAGHGHGSSRKLIMKMDIESAEWDVFDAAPPGVIDQFSQMVVELHDLTAGVHDERRLARMLPILDKLNHSHQCVHVHANTNVPRSPAWIGSLVLPDALEVTYVRRNDVASRLRKNTRQFPTDIDQPSSAGGTELYLGSFSVGGPDAGSGH